MDVQRRACIRGALCDPDGEHEGLSGPFLPFGPEVVRVAIAQTVEKLIALPGILQVRAETERRVPDHEPRVVLLAPKARDISELGVRGHESRPGIPHVLE